MNILGEDTKKYARYSCEGYTLLEILVVLVIMSITTSVAILAIGHHRHKQLSSFAQELHQTLMFAEERALLQPATLGLTFTAHTFGFYEYRQLQNHFSWEPLLDDEFSTHRIPSDIQVTLKVARNLKRTSDMPLILFFTNGTLTPFTLLIGYKNGVPRYEIIGSIDGAINCHHYPE